MPMFEYIIRCAETGLPVATGELTEERVPNISDGGKRLARCPACDGSHIWLAREAWLIPATESDEDQGNDDAELL